MFRLRHLLGCGKVGAVRASGAVFGGGATGNVVRVRQRPPLHLSKHTLLVQQGLKEPCVAVKLHQVIDLKGVNRKERNYSVGDKKKNAGRKKEAHKKGSRKKKTRKGGKWQEQEEMVRS